MFPLYDDNPHRRLPVVTILIIAICVLVHVWLSRQPAINQVRSIVRHGFIPKRVAQLSDPKLVVTVDLAKLAALPPHVKGAVEQLPADSARIYLSMFTMMFLHGSWLHLLSNMWMLWIFGNNIEDRLGHLIYLCFYLVGGLLALACQYLTDPASTIPVVGASGAIAAVLGAYAITYPRAKVRTLVFIVIFVTIVDIPALFWLGGWFLLQVLNGLNIFRVGPIESVAWWAHIGGFVAGLVLMPILALGAPPPGEDWRGEAESLFGPPRE